MPEEVRPQEQGTVAEQSVTDDALSSAWDGMANADPQGATQQATEQETTATAQTAAQETETDEQLDNADKSRIGRRLSKFEQRFNETLNRLDEFMRNSQPNPVLQPPVFQQSQVFQQPTQEEIPEYVTTPAELEKYLQYRERVSAQADVAYQGNYRANLQVLSRLNPDISQEVIDEMMAHFNVRHTGNPVVDSNLNFANAKASVLSKRLAQAKTAPEPGAFRSETGQATAVSSTTRVQPPKQDIPKLDEFAQDFIRRTGMSDESVKAALTGDTPVQFGRRR